MLWLLAWLLDRLKTRFANLAPPGTQPLLAAGPVLTLPSATDHYNGMQKPYSNFPEDFSAMVRDYQSDSNLALLLDRIARLAADTPATVLADYVEPFLAVPEVAGPVYEYIVAAKPNDARALVILANSYWLTGRGPDVVGNLASRAIAADPSNRGAWHLWALTESDPRARVARWKQVSERFPEDDLARVNLADNAASLAGAEHDAQALDLAITTYRSLLASATQPAQRSALEKAISTLSKWRL
ncbi:MAG: hypothetical protein H7Z74_12740 [Anaerolineae bacterium]|nr:hypothetical protein [Gemmatimonadaceae bacterium]